MAYKKYTQFIFDDVERSPEKKVLYGDLGLMYEIFTNLTAMRKKRHLSQHAWAKKAEVTQSSLGRLEGGRANPRLSYLVKIIEALDCKIVIKEKESQFTYQTN